MVTEHSSALAKLSGWREKPAAGLFGDSAQVAAWLDLPT